MGLYRVSGEDGMSQGERVMLVRADSEELARSFARRRGVMVTRVGETQESDVPVGVPVLEARPTHEERRTWLPGIDFDFFPPSVYLAWGVGCCVVAIIIAGWSVVRTVGRMRDAMASGASGIVAIHQFFVSVAGVIALVGAIMIVMGLVRFASYQRDSER
jgi:hypothetical protein